MKSGQVLYPTGHGDVEILFALNRWVRVSVPHGEAVQRQVGNRSELAAVLRELGLTNAEAADAARAAWEQRPASAGLPDAHARQSLRSAAGVPTGLLLVILAALVAALVALALYALYGWGTP